MGHQAASCCLSLIHSVVFEAGSSAEIEFRYSIGLGLIDQNKVRHNCTVADAPRAGWRSGCQLSLLGPRVSRGISRACKYPSRATADRNQHCSGAYTDRLPWRLPPRSDAAPSCIRACRCRRLRPGTAEGTAASALAATSSHVGRRRLEAVRVCRRRKRTVCGACDRGLTPRAAARMCPVRGWTSSAGGEHD
jgi:hypothetical protein